jgi:hypothetical protein
MAEPSSNNCSITGTPDSAPDKRVPFRLQNSILCRLLFFFFTGGAACWELLGGTKSTTRHVVSSLRPRVLNVSYIPKHWASQYETIEMFCTQWAQWIPCKNIPHSLVTQWVLQAYFSTFTMCFAATSGCCKPRQQIAAFSELKASHTPSEAMMSLPPAFESCQKRRRERRCEQSQVLSSHSWYLHSRYYTKSACIIWLCSCSVQDHKVQLSSPNTLHLNE